MILQALYDYYQRKASDPESGIAPEGFEWKEIPFLIVIDRMGLFINLEDTREERGKKKVPQRYLVPKTLDRSGVRSYEVSNRFWDHIGYVLNHPKKLDGKEIEQAKKQHNTWMRFLSSLPESIRESEEVSPILKFYQNDEGMELIKRHSVWEEVVKIAGCNVTFKISGTNSPVPCQEIVHGYIKSKLVEDKASESDIAMGRCLITGEYTHIARTHSSTPISKDSKKLVSIQKNSGYDSYGKEQGYNSPVGCNAEFCYTTALNVLLGKDSANKMRVGDSTTVFWSDRQTQFESDFPNFFLMPPKDDPDRDVLSVKNLLSGAERDAGVTELKGSFYVLGLAPNAARISVRFWYAGDIKQVSESIITHYRDLEIERSDKDVGRYSLFWHLVEIATERKYDNIPPNLAGNLTRAILQKSPYPSALLHQTIMRIRAEQEVTRIRASLLKAYLNRFHRFHPSAEKEIQVALDTQNSNSGYLLGRLFAVLEKIQEDAQPGINTTIRDRFYGAASSNPVMVFSQLLKLKNHHLAKMEKPSFKIAHERRLGEIMDGLPPEMPSHLSLDNQARFAIGYYHQRQALFTKTAKNSN